ncbi:hypothetical protein [Nostoc sp.]|uniref:hypothetical protein n=1 Tax=Nostoc sp. TaxID=1180 RepID=UPI002FF69E0A
MTNTVNELPASPEPEKLGIKELLIQLQTAIEAEENLTPKNKEKVLKQVKALAEASQNPNDEEKQDLADTAITMLKGLISGLPTAATLVEVQQSKIAVEQGIYQFVYTQGVKEAQEKSAFKALSSFSRLD